MLFLWMLFPFIVAIIVSFFVYRRMKIRQGVERSAERLQEATTELNETLERFEERIEELEGMVSEEGKKEPEIP